MIQPNHTSKIHTDSFETNSGEEITCSVYSSFQEIADLREEWDSFVESAQGDIFLTFDWCRLWWQYYGSGRELRLYIFRNSCEIVGIIPFFFEKVWLCFIFIRVGKIVGSDFTLAQFSLPIRPQYLDLCVRCFLEAIKPIHWHLLSIGPLAGLSANTEALKNALCRFSNNAERITIRDEGVQTYYKLQPTWEKYLASLGKRHRQEIVHKYRELGRTTSNGLADLKVIPADEKNLNSFFKAFVDLHEAHWRKLGKLGHFGDWPAAFDFHRDMAVFQLARGRLRLLGIHLRSDVLGYEYAYKFGDKYYGILNARTEDNIYNKIGIGAIIHSEHVKGGISEKIAYIDSMRGKYEHKLRLGGELFTMKNISVIKKGIINSFCVNLFRMFTIILDFMYYRIWFRRIAPKLPFKRRPLWKLWIRTRL